MRTIDKCRCDGENTVTVTDEVRYNHAYFLVKCEACGDYCSGWDRDFAIQLWNTKQEKPKIDACPYCGEQSNDEIVYIRNNGMYRGLVSCSNPDCDELPFVITKFIKGDLAARIAAINKWNSQVQDI